MRVLVALGCAVAMSLAANVSRADEPDGEPAAPGSTDAPAAPGPTYAPPPPAPKYAPPPPPPTYAPVPYYYGGGPGYYYYAPPPKPKGTWYGWQTLLTDGLALTMLYAAADGRGDDGLVYGAVATYNLGAPIVHFGHKNYGRGLASLAVRSLPSILIFGDTNASTDLALLTLISVPTMIAVDAAALAREDAPEPAPRGPYGMKMSPTASATKNGGLVGVAGTF